MNTTARTILLTGLITLISAAACARPAPEPPPVASTPAGSRLRESGKAAAITIYPVLLAGQPSPQVGEALGMLLERAGMTALELTESPVAAPAGAAAAESARAFSDAVRASPPATDYALLAEILASPERRVTEVRAVIVDRRGEVLWQDVQRRGDAAFDRLRPAEPLTCCVLISQRLRPVLSLDDPSRTRAAEGRLARRWKQATGVPSAEEAAAIDARAAAFRKAARASTLTVYPARIGAELSPESGARLANLINEKSLVRSAAPAPAGPSISTVATMNEQRILWTAAREFSAWLKANPPSSDYALMPDYLMGPGGPGAVHVILCDREGEIVAADFQNSHHPGFQAAKPRTPEDCDALALTRLASFVR